MPDPKVIASATVNGRLMKAIAHYSVREKVKHGGTAQFVFEFYPPETYVMMSTNGVGIACAKMKTTQMNAADATSFGVPIYAIDAVRLGTLPGTHPYGVIIEVLDDGKVRLTPETAGPTVIHGNLMSVLYSRNVVFGDAKLTSTKTTDTVQLDPKYLTPIDDMLLAAYGERWPELETFSFTMKVYGETKPIVFTHFAPEHNVELAVAIMPVKVDVFDSCQHVIPEWLKAGTIQYPKPPIKSNEDQAQKPLIV